MSKSACGSVGNIGQLDWTLKRMDFPSHAIRNWGGISHVSCNAWIVRIIPNNPVTSLQKALWLAPVPGVCISPITWLVKSFPLLIQAANPADSLYDLSLTAWPKPSANSCFRSMRFPVTWICNFHSCANLVCNNASRPFKHACHGVWIIPMSVKIQADCKCTTTALCNPPSIGIALGCPSYWNCWVCDHHGILVWNNQQLEVLYYSQSEASSQYQPVWPGNQCPSGHCNLCHLSKYRHCCKVTHHNCQSTGPIGGHNGHWYGEAWSVFPSKHFVKAFFWSLYKYQITRWLTGPYDINSE